MKIFRFNNLKEGQVLPHPCGVIVGEGQLLSCSLLVTAYTIDGKEYDIDEHHEYKGFNLILLMPNFKNQKEIRGYNTIFVNKVSDRYLSIYGQ